LTWLTHGRHAAIGPALILCVSSACLFLVLAGLVAAQVTDSVDASARQLFRPDDVWGATQLRADVIVEGLRPSRVGLLLPVAGAVTAFLQRSWAPVVVAGQLGASTIVVVVVTKRMVGQPDTHGQLGGFGGSFPSGHIAVLLVVLGGTLIVAGRSAWWAWVATYAVGLVMAICLLVQATHWLTDVVGGFLLATCLLTSGLAHRGLWRTPSTRPAPEASGRGRSLRPLPSEGAD
jgi:membrane-associated phospholipid phosphatase